MVSCARWRVLKEGLKVRTERWAADPRGNPDFASGISVSRDGRGGAKKGRRFSARKNLKTHLQGRANISGPSVRPELRAVLNVFGISSHAVPRGDGFLEKTLRRTCFTNSRKKRPSQQTDCKFERLLAGRQLTRRSDDNDSRDSANNNWPLRLRREKRWAG